MPWPRDPTPPGHGGAIPDLVGADESGAAVGIRFVEALALNGFHASHIPHAVGFRWGETGRDATMRDGETMRDIERASHGGSHRLNMGGLFRYHQGLLRLRLRAVRIETFVVRGAGPTEDARLGELNQVNESVRLRPPARTFQHPWQRFLRARERRRSLGLGEDLR